MDDPAVSPPSRRAVVVVGLVALAAALVFASTFAVLEWRRADRSSHTLSGRDAVATTAGQFGVDLFTYDYTDFPAGRARVLKLASTKFAKSYDAANGPALQATVTKLKVRASAKVVRLFTTTVNGAQAEAVVALDTRLQSTEGSRQSLTYLELALVRQGGQWKVDAAKTLSSSAPPAAPAPATTRP
jgi:hypothetical protein